MCALQQSAFFKCTWIPLVLQLCGLNLNEMDTSLLASMVLINSCSKLTQNLLKV